MNELTMLLFVCALGLFILMYVLKKDPAVSWIALFVSVCSMGQTLTDETLLDMEVVLMVVPMLYIFFMSGLMAMYRKAI